MARASAFTSDSRKHENMLNVSSVKLVKPFLHNHHTYVSQISNPGVKVNKYDNKLLKKKAKEKDPLAFIQ